MNKENNPPSSKVGTKKITDFFVKDDKTPTRVSLGTTDRTIAVARSGNKSIQKMLKTANTLSEIREDGFELGKSGEEKKAASEKLREYETKIALLEKDKDKKDQYFKAKMDKFEDDFRKYKMKVINVVARNVLENENYKRAERKAYLNQ